MVKSDKGQVEIKGSKDDIIIETAMLLNLLRKHISEDEFKRMIEDSKKTEDEIKAEIREAKKRISEMLKEILFDEEER